MRQQVLLKTRRDFQDEDQTPVVHIGIDLVGGMRTDT